MDWTAGYASDVEYTAEYYVEQAPAHLNFACVLNGCEPVDTSVPYTYLELGCGRGLTASVLAASNPLGSFYAVDFNPAHIAGALALAKAAALPNLTLLESSFEEVAGGALDLPRFDFITLHGVYTWVTAENRRHIAGILARYLKPGGIAYLSYNAMPGWSTGAPLQRLLFDAAALRPGRSDLQVTHGASFVSKLAATNSGYFAGNPRAQQSVEGFSQHSPAYLVHEYLHRHWQPMYHADVAADLAEAKLDYVGSAALAHAYPAVIMPADCLAMYQGIADATLRETAKDFFLNTMFRKDVFVRGPRRLSRQRKDALLSRFGAALTVPRRQASTQLKLPSGELAGAPSMYVPLFDVLARGPQSLPQLMGGAELAGKSFDTLVQALALLQASGQCCIYQAGAPEAPAEAAQRLNRALVAGIAGGNDYQVMASPVLGGGVRSDIIDGLLYDGLAAGVSGADGLARHVWAVLQQRGAALPREDGTPIPDAEGNLAALRQRIAPMLDDGLAGWRGLGVYCAP